MTATTSNIRGRVNVAAGGQLAATSDTSPVFRFRTAVDNSSPYRTAALILTGTWVGTVSLQYSAPEMGVWDVVPGGVFTSNTIQELGLPGSADYRWIFTSRTSGTVNAWIVP